MRLTSGVDQRCDGVSKAVIAQDKEKQALVSILVKRIMESNNKTQLVDELFPKGLRFTHFSERSKQII